MLRNECLQRHESQIHLMQIVFLKFCGFSYVVDIKYIAKTGKVLDSIKYLVVFIEKCKN